MSRQFFPYILAILLVAAFFRFYNLAQLPPGLNFDEAGNGVAAAEILAGSPKLWWRIGGGKEPLWPYLIALATTMWGYAPFTLRITAAFTGILTVAAVYILIVRVFKQSQVLTAYVVALLTALGLALSQWHLHFSRLGFRAVLLPLLSALAFYFFWAGLTQPQHAARSYLLSAFFSAMAIYAYLAARLLPLVFILFLSLGWLIGRLSPGEPADSVQSNQARARTSLFQTPISILLFLALFLGPLLFYFLANPADFAARTATVSVFNPAWNQGNLLGTVLETLALTLGTFLGARGDVNPLVNLPGQPALPLFAAPFFVFGLVISLYRVALTGLRSSRANDSDDLSNFKRVSPSRSPHLFLLCWWIIMLLPAALAPEGAPHHLRLLGTIGPTYALLAVGLLEATLLVQKLLSRWQPDRLRISQAAYLLPIMFYLLLGLQTGLNYFVRWPNAADFTLPFDLYAARLAADIAHTPKTASFVIPMDIRAGEEARHYTLDYLLSPGSTESLYTYIPVDEENAERLLSQAARDKDTLHLVRWTDDKHREADAKEIITFLLATSAQAQGHDTYPVYDIESYAIAAECRADSDCSPTVPRFVLPSTSRPLGANFDDLLRLDAAFVPLSVSAGSDLPVALTFAPLAAMNVDYKASLRLTSPSGERLAQKDRSLMHNFHQGTSLWPPETVNEYYLLPIPDDLPPGEYTVHLVIYHPETQAPLVANGLVEVPVGTVTVE